ISLGRTDGLDIRDAEHAQEDLLDDVRHIRDVADAGHEETPELIPVRCREVCHQRLRIVEPQPSPPDLKSVSYSLEERLRSNRLPLCAEIFSGDGSARRCIL